MAKAALEGPATAGVVGGFPELTQVSSVEEKQHAGANACREENEGERRPDEPHQPHEDGKNEPGDGQ